MERGDVDLSSGQFVPKEFHLISHPFAFGGFRMESRLGQSAQDPSDVLYVFLDRGGMDEDVIHVDGSKMFGTLHNMVHYPLKRGGGIH